MTALVVVLALAGLALLLWRRSQMSPPPWLLYAGLGLILGGLLLALVRGVIEPPSDYNTATDPLAALLAAECEAGPVLIVHTPAHPFLPRARGACSDAALVQVTNTFNAVEVHLNPYAVREPACQKAMAAHPDCSTVLLLMPLPPSFGDWNFDGKRVIVGNGDASRFASYPEEVAAAFHAKPPPESGWALKRF